jgi:diadenosine tetraphosphate (Ap4A) HIT family hydrolase
MHLLATPYFRETFRSFGQREHGLAKHVNRHGSILSVGEKLQNKTQAFSTFHQFGRLSQMTANQCPFCNVDGSRILAQSEVGIALPDAFPVTEGHTLVIPKRHVASLYELTPEEQADLWRFAAEVRAKLVEEFHPDGFNVGVNDGRAAGQTVMHAHIHVIPRYVGDTSDPRGGIRWVMSKKASYWKKDS